MYRVDERTMYDGLGGYRLPVDHHSAVEIPTTVRAGAEANKGQREKNVKSLHSIPDHRALGLLFFPEYPYPTNGNETRRHKQSYVNGKERRGSDRVLVGAGLPVIVL